MVKITANELRTLTADEKAKKKYVNNYVAALYDKVIQAALDGQTSCTQDITTFPNDDSTNQTLMVNPILVEGGDGNWAPILFEAAQETFPDCEVTCNEAAGITIQWLPVDPRNPQPF